MSTKDAQDGVSTSFPSGDAQDPSNAVNDDNGFAILVYAAAALVILPILYKLGAGASVLVLVLSIALNAIPEVRQIIDSFLGKSPSGRHRLPIQIASGSRSPDNEVNEKPSIYDERPTSEELQYVGLDVGDVLQIPLTRLVALIQRDFISFWYNTSVCLSPSTPFPMHTQSLLNTTMNNLVSRMRRQEPKEVSIYLFHSASTAIISQIRQAKSSSSHPQDTLKEKDELLRKVRRTSEELLLTLAPRSATSSPIVLSLLSEVLSLQIWSTIQSVGNADFINTSIVSHFGKAVNVVKKVQADAAKADPSQQQSLDVSEPSNNESSESIDEAVQMAEKQIEAAAEEKDMTPPALPPRVDKGKGRARDSLQSEDMTFAASAFPGMLSASAIYPGQVAQEAINKTNTSVAPENKTTAPPSAPVTSTSTLSHSGPASAEAGASNLHRAKPSLTAAPLSPSSSTSGISQPSSARSPPPSTPSSPGVNKTAKLPETERYERNITDRTLDEAIDAGVVKLRSFGTRFLTGATKLLDAALPPDEPTARTPITPTTKAPSLKGKERERDPADSPRGSIDSGRPASPRPASIASRIAMASSSMGLGGSGSSSSDYGATSGIGLSSSRPGSRRSSVILSAISSPATSTSVLASGQQPPQASTPMLPSVRCQIILDTFLTANAESRGKQVKALERSLFSKDPSLLFPEPQDPQLKAVLAHHITSSDTSDPELVQVSDNFHKFLEDGEHEDGEALLRLWTQLDHFGYMVSMTRATEQQMQEDAIGVMKKTVAQTVDLQEMQNADKETVDGFWTAVETGLLRLAQNPTKDLFEPLQDWYMKMVQTKYWELFLHQNPKDMAMSQTLDLVRSPTQSTFSSINDNFPEQSTSTSMSRSASTKMTRSISSSSNKPPSPSVTKRTLDWSNAALQKDDSLDLGESMSMHDDPEPIPVLSQSRPSSVYIGQSSVALKDDAPDAADDVAMPGLEDKNVPSGLTSESTTTLTSLASSSMEEASAPPNFSVTLTDLSPPSAYVNNHVKNRKELEFLIAVEVEGSPGYILARKYLEFEKMDAGIKKALPQSGTKAFPRAPLPSTNFQTSENLCNSLSHYLEALLHDDRYAASEPVATFFAKERTDSKGTAQPLAFLGRGVNNIGKGVTGVTRGIGKSGEMAIGGIATGFNQFGKAVTTIPGLRKSPSGAVDALKGKDESRESVSDVEGKSPVSSLGALQLDTQPAESVIDSQAEEALPLDAQPVDARDGKELASQPPPLPPRSETLPVRSSSPEGYVVSSPPTVPDVRPEAPPGFNYTPRRKHTGPANMALLSAPTSPSHQQSLPLPQIQVPTSPVLRGRMSFEELVQKDEEAQKVQRANSEDVQPTLLKAAPMSKTTSEPGAESPRAPSPNPNLSLAPMEFNNVLSFAMAILEEAYDLVDSTWNLKRGILKMLETILRTSYANVIKAGMTKLVTMASQEDFYAQGIDDLRESFWPPPDDIWWSSVPDYKPTAERTAEEKEATRKEARHLVIMQAPEGLKVSLGAAATAEAFGRLHDSLQGPGGERLVAGLLLDYLRLLLL